MKKINLLIEDTYLESKNASWAVAEPFVGGGGSLINMAENFKSWTFHINDSNPEVASMWRFLSFCKDAEIEKLYDLIRSQQVTVETYRQIFEKNPGTDLEKAFKVIFLNKTSYNGYITELLPIGGMEQKSAWGVDVYWKPENIIKKINRARKAIAGRIVSVSCEDFEPFLKSCRYDFSYADPPYIAYGKQWYNCNFDIKRLKALKDLLVETDRWCISIDRNKDTEEMFKDDNILGVEVFHSAKSRYLQNFPIGTKIQKSNEIVAFPSTTRKIYKNILTDILN